jgi:predicted acetyltransferase
MPQLVDPSGRLRGSFLAAVAELRAEDGDARLLVDDANPDTLNNAASFEEFVRQTLASREPGAARPDGYAPVTTLWWAQDTMFLGRLDVRHHLTPALLLVGGHIGYVVRPSARGRGHATAMLAAALPYARALGIDRALLTCDVDNVASQRVIEANGGEFWDVAGPKRRYWVPTGSSS